jgi:hypothetical protein
VTDETETRKCICGCGKDAQPYSKYAFPERCRSRAYRNRVREEADAKGVSAHLTLGDLRNGTTARVGHTPAPARKRTRRAPDLRVSYRKAVDAISLPLADRLEISETLARNFTEGCLRPLLSEKAQKQLEGSRS